MTLEELFKKYPGLEDAKESGVEISQFIEPDSDGLDLLVITSTDETPGSHSWSGFDNEADGNEVGSYLLHFPYHARTLIFSTVDDIDKHLTLNKGQFRLPGYSYSEK